MTDLRTRIAKAICGSTSAGRTFPWATLNERERDAWGSMADAVIRELGLYRESNESRTVTNKQGARYRIEGGYRYVTEWSSK